MTILQDRPGAEVLSPSAAPAAKGGGKVEGGAEDRGARPGAPALPATSPSAARTRARWASVTIVLPLAGLTALAGLMGWAAFSNQNSAAPSSWEAVPSGQPYAVVPPVPKVPHATAAAGSVGAAKATKLPVMTTAAVSANVTLKVDPQPLGGNYGPDGQVQDVFSPAFFSVPAGQRVKVTVYNYDSAGHSFTAPALGLDVWIPGGGAASPSVTTFTFHPGSAGTYLWVCGVPCDPFSMATPGYMRGEIHVVRQ